MDINDVIHRLEVVEKNFDFWLLSALEEVAINAISLVVNRIQQEGLPGKQYSDQKLPPYFFYGKELNAGGRNILQRKDKKALRVALTAKGEKLKKNTGADQEDDGISYREWREANGLQVSIVDLTFTGRMLQNLGILESQKQDGIYRIVIGGLDKEVKDKLKWNAQRFGDFFAFTEEEKKLLGGLLKSRMMGHIRSVGL